MALVLRPDLELGKAESDGCVLLSPREPKPARPIFQLHPFQGMVLALLDGEREKEEVLEIVSQVFDRPRERVKPMVEGVFGRYRQFLVPRESVNGDLCTYEPTDFIFSTSRDFTRLREAAPMGLMWVVTECCNKKCRYCYKDAVFVGDGRATDLELSFDRVRELLAEAQEIGVTSIVLSGGEPFLRPDLLEIIGLAVQHGLEVIPITKARIVGERMKTLVATGLAALHVSFDSHQPEMVDFLTGVPGAFQQIVDTLKAADQYGMHVVLRPVLTSYNIRHAEGLVELAYGLGVREFMADIYGESCGRHDEIFEVSTEDFRWLRGAWERLSERFPDAEMQFKFDKPEVIDKMVGRGCVEGARGLTFLADGKATKCEHWRFGAELTYGDLKTQSIMEVWGSQAIEKINYPPRESFAGTPCFRCKKLETCHYNRGRCSLSALLEYGTFSAPDVHCPIGAFKKRTQEGRSHAACA